MHKILMAAALVFLVGCGTIPTAPGSAQWVLSGDSIQVGQQRIRLIGYDAPEARQVCQHGGGLWACGRMATDALKSLVRGFKIDCLGDSTRIMRPMMATCDANGVDLAAAMVRNGWGVATTGGPYLDEQQEAQDARRGIWRGMGSE